VENVNAVASAAQLSQAVKTADRIFVADPIFEYIASLAAATRNNELIKLGLSPRGTIALLKMSKAAALLGGRDFVIPDDVLYVFPEVSAHRILLSSKAKINGITVNAAIKNIVSKVSVPKIER
jgi:MoxR-like ATPase